jgi:hypothetical protein
MTTNDLNQSLDSSFSFSLNEQENDLIVKPYETHVKLAVHRQKNTAPLSFRSE